MLAMSAAFAAILAGGFLVLMLAIDNQRSAGRIALRAEQAIATGRSLETLAVNLDNGVRGFVLTGRRGSLAPFNAARAAYPERLAALRQLATASPRERALVGRIDEEIRDYVDLWGLPLISLARERPEAARSVLRNTTGRERIDTVRRQFDALFRAEREIAADRQGSAESRSDTAMVLGGAGIALVLGMSFALWLYLRRSIVRPVTDLAAATEAVAAGDLGTRVDVSREDEIGTLGHGFNAMTAELERSNRDLQDFAAVASHDLQGPLITIGKLAELLSAHTASKVDPTEVARHISASTDRLNDLVGDLLAYAKVGQGELRRRAVELDEVVQQALDNLEGPIEAAQAEVVVESLPSVEGDPARLCQLLQNLVGNAVKFANGGTPRVRITGETIDGQARVSVSDNGVGFDNEHAARIFRPFQRLHPVDRYEGSGIGLAICARIVAQHGGRIWAEGREGEGATFHVELPAADK